MTYPGPNPGHIYHAPQSPPPKRRKLPIVLGSILVAVALFCVAGSITTGVKQASDGHARAIAVDIATPSTMPTPADKTKPKATATAKPAPTATTKALTAEQVNAVGTAEDYLSNQHFSRKGLIGQLKYEGYSTKVATVAVDSLRVDWNKQAVGTAEDYLDGQHFSRSGLIGQLEYEGYSHAQAVHGVNGAGL